ncbi:MAG: hypothetical protein NC238_02845 [Dehalobacter sp.]|nr:hypothetical protein [Dehalobacter sp.]
MAQTKEVNIMELAKGAILEQIDHAMKLVMENILDPNTEVKTPRKLTINLTFKPDESREIVNCSAQAKPTLAPIKPIVTNIIVEADREGNPMAAELTRDNPNQVTMFAESEEQKVIRIAK